VIGGGGSIVTVAEEWDWWRRFPPGWRGGGRNTGRRPTAGVVGRAPAGNLAG